MSSPPTPNQIKEADEEFWRWMFSVDDGTNHPLKISNNDKAQMALGRILILAGALAADGPKNRSLEIDRNIDYIFVPSDNCVYTSADNDGSGQVLIDKANKDMARGEGMVLVNGKNQRIEPLSGHPFQLNIQKAITGTGKSKKGEGWIKGKPLEATEAASACHYAIIPAKILKDGDTIQIKGRQGEGIDVTYKVIVK